jgi:sugar/nucleoside kinase (ribokinase family)
MISLIGATNWDVVVSGELPDPGRVAVAEVMYEGPAGSTVNAASHLLDRRPLLITQVPARLDPRHADLLSRVELVAAQVEALNLALVGIGEEGERTILLATRPTSWPAPPPALAKAAVVDWHWTVPAEILPSYAPLLHGAVVATARSVPALLEHGVAPFAVVDSLTDAEPPGDRWLRKSGCRWCVVTEGAGGGRYWVDGRWQAYSAAPAAEVVDSSGCGDAFRAGLLAAIDDGWGIERAVTLAARLGAEAAALPAANRFLVRPATTA